MLIFVVTPLFPNIYNNQYGIYVYEQCRTLHKAGNKVIVLDISPVRWKRWGDKSCKEIMRRSVGNIEVYTLNPRGLLSSRLPRYTVFSAWNNLKKLYSAAALRHGRPDIFHAHFTFPAGYITSKLSKRINIPFVVTEHYSLFLKPKIHEYTKKILNETINNASEFICVSNNLKSAIEKWVSPKKNICVIPNLIDDRFKYHRMVPKEGKFVFFSAGNLVESKGFDLLIESFSSAFDSQENVCLNIAGDGKDFNKLLDMIKKKNRQKQIRLLGRLNRDEMLKQYVECDCFVLPSKYETFGIVYREAMAVGRPVISTKNGGIEEGWEDNFGILVPIGDKQSLSEALLKIYERKDTFNPEYISKKCLQQYSSDVIGARIDYILKSVVKSDLN
mgnify:CR=1 FL=1